MSQYENLPKSEIQLGGSVDLPFNYIPLWWKNGNTQLAAAKDSDPVLYYGGWASHAEKYQVCGIAHPSLQPFTWSNRQGKQYSVLATRFVWAALIVARQGWFPKDRDNPHLGNRSAENFLVMLATSNPDKSLTKLGPGVLSGTSYSGQAIRDTFNQWNGASAAMRAQLVDAPANIPDAWYFYIPVGTLKSEIFTDSKSSKDGKHASVITPCHTSDKLINGVTKEMLDRYFVGAETANEMKMYANLATDWVAHWKDREQQNATIAASTKMSRQQAYSYNEPDYPEEPPWSPDADDDLPF